MSLYDMGMRRVRSVGYLALGNLPAWVDPLSLAAVEKWAPKSRACNTRETTDLTLDQT